MTDGEDEIICDLAETYHILNYQELPPDLVATLVLGLPDHSRIKRKYQKRKTTLTEELLALILDDFNALLWSMSKHGQRPKSVYKILTEDPQKKEDLQAFESPDDYEAWRKKKEEQWKCQRSQQRTSK